MTYLCRLHQLATHSRSEDFLGDVLVGVANSLKDSVLVQLVEAVNEDLTGIAADIGDTDHGDNRPVATVENGVWQRDDEHALWKDRA